MFQDITFIGVLVQSFGLRLGFCLGVKEKENGGGGGKPKLLMDGGGGRRGGGGRFDVSEGGGGGGGGGNNDGIETIVCFVLSNIFVIFLTLF